MNIFQRPQRTAAPPRASKQAAQAQPAAETPGPWPRWDATFVMLLGLISTAFALTSDYRVPSELAHAAAIGVGCSLAASFAFEIRSGLTNLVRADLMCLAAFYYLTLYEFLFPQRYFDRDLPHIGTAYGAIWAVLTGFGGICIGRHLMRRGAQPFANVMQRPMPPQWLLIVFWASFILGYYHMLLAEDFDIPKMIEDMMKPRFEQPWGRGRFGDWKALLNELALLLYFIPPLAGLMLARRERYRAVAIITVVLGFLWTLFYGFVGGTRSQFGAYLITFMIALAFATPREKRKQIVIAFTACASALVLSTDAMLQMRTVGFQNWWDGKYKTIVNRQTSSVFVDDNLLTIAKIVQFFPAQHEYLGLEVPTWALIRPIPRALWPGKPEGLSLDLEGTLFNLKGMTVSSTFVGESYLAGGFLAVALQSLVIGWLAGWWSRFASAKNSELGILIYASGFFAVVITMRSLFSMMPALLTPAAGILAGHFLIKGARRVIGRRRPVLPPRLRKMPPSPPPA